MRVNRRFSPSSRVVLSLIIPILAFSVVRAAQSSEQPTFNIGIKNFGKVNEHLYRGAQPSGRDYSDLAALGVKAVVDLEREGEADEQQLVEAAGMRFFRISMSDRSAPAPESAEQFLKIVTDPANQPVFFHCHGGRHRTGAMGAVYRITNDGWTADRAYEEMKQYEFTKGMGHSALKDFVFDYYSKTINAEVRAER